ncbi:hypothetical protein OAW32_00055 [bacterium]|nr:hypothetical protein [bacterium]
MKYTITAENERISEMTSKIRLPIRLAPILLVSACALFPPSLVEQGIVRIDIGKSKPVSVKKATTYVDDGTTVVRGEAAFPSSSFSRHFTGHIDIKIALPDGKVIAQNNVKLFPKRIPKKRGRRATFVSSFDVELPKGTVVHVTYHDRRHANSG